MPLLALDTETTGLDLYLQDRMFSYSTCDTSGETGVYRLDGSPVRRHMSKWHLEEVMQGASEGRMTLTLHNAKFDLTAIERYLGRHIAEGLAFHDTRLMSHLLQSDHPTQGLKDLAWELARIPRRDAQAVRRWSSEGGDFSRVPEHLMDEYQRLDAYRTILLHLFFFPKIRENPRFVEIYRMERDLIPVTMRMEERGLMIDRRRCEGLIVGLQRSLEEVRAEVTKQTGRRLNLSRVEDLVWFLYEFGRIPVGTRTATGKPSTAKEILLELHNSLSGTRRDEIIRTVIKHRAYVRGVAILRGYLRFADGDDVIHPNVKTCGARTGRESCSRPNLQNVEKTETLLNLYPVPARQVFRPRPGCVNVHIDYSGIEMRLLVHYAQPPSLVEILRHGGDVHEPAALLFWGDEYRNAEGVRRKSLRNASKNANFALPYGSGADTLARTLGVTLDRAQGLYQDYKARFPELIGLTPKIVEMVRGTGFVEDVFGRRIRVPRDEAYVGTNYLIQGTASGIIKRAQVRLSRLLAQGTSGEVRLLLPVHDELVIEVPRKRLKDFQGLLPGIRREMIDFPQFSVPLDIEADCVTVNWSRKSHLEIPK